MELNVPRQPKLSSSSEAMDLLNSCIVAQVEKKREPVTEDRLPFVR